jgi:triphosphoribosyl-dephospho-CoA synthase
VFISAVFSMNGSLSICQCATLACLLEATAPKVGNVHRGADFHDVTFADFAVSAVAMGPAIESAASQGVGRAVYDAVARTRELVATNTNLGMALLLAPLAAAPRDQPLTTASLQAVLHRLTPNDSRLVYEAIRLARPGGLGNVDSMDVADEPPTDLLTAMRAATDRDLIARQYAESFRLVLDVARPALVAGVRRGWSLTDAVIHTHLSLIAEPGDTLIVRKCGPQLAGQASAIAARILAIGSPGEEAYLEALADFDFWLRSDGHRRNPGSTADIIAAALFAGLRDGLLPPPWR